MADSENTFTVNGRRGRPRGTEPGSTLTAYVPASYHDRITQLAIKHDISVSQVVRRVLDQAFKKKL
jgi:hypothetical protein